MRYLEGGREMVLCPGHKLLDDDFRVSNDSKLTMIITLRTHNIRSGRLQISTEFWEFVTCPYYKWEGFRRGNLKGRMSEQVTLIQGLHALGMELKRLKEQVNWPVRVNWSPATARTVQGKGGGVKVPGSMARTRRIEEDGTDATANCHCKSFPTFPQPNCILTSCVFFLSLSPKETSRRPSTSNPFCIRSLYFFFYSLFMFSFKRSPSLFTSFFFRFHVRHFPYFYFYASVPLFPPHAAHFPFLSLSSIPFHIHSLLLFVGSSSCFPFTPSPLSPLLQSTRIFSFPKKQYIKKNMTGKEWISFTF